MIYTRFFSALALALGLAAVNAGAQEPQCNTATLICRSNDGVIEITRSTLRFRDYNFIPDQQLQHGVMRMVDPASSAVAVVDARDAEGLYLTITEGSLTMQVVVARTATVLKHASNDHTAQQPASELSASDLILLVQGAPLASSR